MNEYVAVFYLGFIVGQFFQMSGIPAWMARQTERGSHAFARWIVGKVLDWRERRAQRDQRYYKLTPVEWKPDFDGPYDRRTYIEALKIVARSERLEQ